MNGGGGGPAAFFYERYQNLVQLLTKSIRFYQIISKTKGVEPKIKLLVFHGTRRDIFPPPPPLSEKLPPKKGGSFVAKQNMENSTWIMIQIPLKWWKSPSFVSTYPRVN